jgi:hypothetical protein
VVPFSSWWKASGGVFEVELDRARWYPGAFITVLQVRVGYFAASPMHLSSLLVFTYSIPLFKPPLY